MTKKDLAVSLLKALRTTGCPPLGHHLLVAVSGGADSMALLHLYTQLRDEGLVNITAATFNHGLRGQAGADDAQFVAETCAAWGVPCIVGQGNLDPDAPGVEARARDARYTFLATTAHDIGAAHLATAHHADDQAETVLLNLIRGTGLRGLGGMRPVAHVPGAPQLVLLRPLLRVRRADLEAYCRAEGIAWRDDPTNTDTKYRRNWVRHTVLPLLAEANPTVVEALARTADIASEDADYLDGEARAIVFAQPAAVTPDRIWLRREQLHGLHPALFKRVIRCAADHVNPQAEIEYAPLQAAVDLMQAPEGGTVELGAGVDVVADSAFVAVERHGATWTPPYDGFWIEDVRLEGAGDAPTVKVNAPPTATFTLRARQDGDRVYPLHLGGKSQKLKEWFINRKIPRLIRDHLPLIVAESVIVALWDGQQWYSFAPPFEGKMIEIVLTIYRNSQ